MSDSYAIYFSSEDCTHIAPIKTLTTLLKQQIIFFLLLCLSHGHHILLDYFASDHTLPKIAKGSIDPLTVLKGSHPLKLFQLYQSCAKMKSLILQLSAKQKLSDLCARLFHTCPTRVLSFKINTFDVLLMSFRIIKQKRYIYIYTYIYTPISPDMLTLLKLQTIVIFTGHPKIGRVFTNHIAWLKRWFFGLFPSAHSQMAPLLNISLSKTLTYRSWDP